MTEVLNMEPLTLRVADRCDVGQCGAQAYVITMHDGFTLMWCAHHAKNPLLLGTEVIDTSATLVKSTA